MPHVLALDQGTTGSTCLMLNGDGRITGRGYREITQYYPAPGWVEHDPRELLESTLAAALDAISAAGALPDAIGITNQRETVIVWDRETGAPVSRAIVWQDRRTAARCAELADREHGISALTGLVVDPYFSATKLEWMLRDEGTRRRAEGGLLAAGTVDTWLIWQLTGGAVHATDPTNASRTLLYDINSMSWSDALLDLFGVPRSLLPEVRRSSGDFGLALGKHLGVEVPIRGVAGDQQAALFGQGCWEKGTSKNTYGTGAFLLLNAGEQRPQATLQRDGLLTTIACDANGDAVYALEGSVFIAGAAVQWLRDGLGIIGSASETEGIARTLESNGGVYFVPALVGLGAPYWEPEARGAVVGLTRASSAAHLVRAALEAMAYGTRDVLQVMLSRIAGGGASISTLRVDGGAASNNWLMQFQADLLGIPVERPSSVETTALGAAALAGIGAGIWSSAQEFIQSVNFDRFDPVAGEAQRSLREADYAGWKRAVEMVLHGVRVSHRAGLAAPPPAT